VFFSYTNNTRKIANILHEKVGGDIAEIATVKPYLGDYNFVVDQGQRENAKGFKPEIKPMPPLDKYDIIYVCSPIWWYTIAPAVHTFLEDNDLTCNIIAPLMTNGGYGLGHSVSDIKKYSPGAKVLDALELSFEEDQIQTSLEEIDKWLNKM